MAPQHRVVTSGSRGRGRRSSGVGSSSPSPLGRSSGRDQIYPSAFRIAFQNAMKGHVDEKLGPVLSGRKKLIVAKLAEEGVERKVKGEAKKEKHLIEERGHVEPANFLDSRQKFLIGVATKGALTKRSKEAFFSELIRASGQSVEETTKASASEGAEDNGQPAWARYRTLSCQRIPS